MVEVEIIGQVITHQYGTLNTGDTLRTSAEFAKHLVEDCCTARYRAQPEAQAVAVEMEAEQAAATVPDPDPKSTPTPKSARAKK